MECKRGIWRSYYIVEIVTQRFNCYIDGESGETNECEDDDQITKVTQGHTDNSDNNTR